jgi:hypothetical protein
MQRLRVALCLVFVVLLGSCGDEPPKATAPAALKYVPADADAVVIVPTDLHGRQPQRLGALVNEDAGTTGDDAPQAADEGASREGVDARLRIEVE